MSDLEEITTDSSIELEQSDITIHEPATFGTMMTLMDEIQPKLTDGEYMRVVESLAELKTNTENKWTEERKDFEVVYKKQYNNIEKALEERRNQHQKDTFMVMSKCYAELAHLNENLAISQHTHPLREEINEELRREQKKLFKLILYNAMEHVMMSSLLYESQDDIILEELRGIELERIKLFNAL